MTLPQGGRHGHHSLTSAKKSTFWLTCMAKAPEKACHHPDTVVVEVRHQVGELRPFHATHHVVIALAPKVESDRTTIGHHRNPTHRLRALPAQELRPRQNGAHHCSHHPPKTAPSVMTLKIFESRCPKGYHANFGLSSSFSLSRNVHQCGKEPVMHPAQLRLITCCERCTSPLASSLSITQLAAGEK